MSRPSTIPAIPTRSRASRPTTRIVLAGGVALGALLLAGCGSGMQAQTSEQVAAVAGANTEAGTILIRNAEITYPVEIPDSANVYRTGSVAPLSMTIVNTGNSGDRLVSATSPAGTVTITGNGSLPSQRALVAAEAGAEPTPGATTITVEITGLREDIRAGLSYPVVLNFEKAGPVTVQVPVGAPSEPREDHPEAAGEGGH
ncbi:MAG: hypothetical protein OJJ54_12405 [Pseudonocardia sp.]|nr:hypothetical protein [Pseudonocardia sp.]